MLVAFLGLERRLLPVSELAHQPGGGRGAGREPEPGQTLGQVDRRLGGPAQQRHRVPTRLRRDQRVQRLQDARLRTWHRWASRTRRPDPTVIDHTVTDLPGTLGHGVDRRPRDPGHQTDPAPTDGLGLSPQQMPPLPLVQQRPHPGQLVRQRLLIHLATIRNAHEVQLPTATSQWNYNHVIYA
jgi:hypothetical protein